jgi:RNA polymerase sigma-70 factor (ECF subfamily)
MNQRNDMKCSSSSASSASSDLIPTRASLLARLKDWDDSRSWQEFFDTYWRLVYGRARRAELSDQEAQEVVQETVIAVAKRMHEFKYDPAVASFKTWLFQIVSRRIADQYRKRRRAGPTLEARPAADDDARLTGPEAEASVHPDEAWEREWEANLLAAAVERVKRRVKPEHFQVFDYHVLQGHSAAETARHLRTNAGAVYLLKHRVRRLVRKEALRLRETLL